MIKKNKRINFNLAISRGGSPSKSFNFTKAKLYPNSFFDTFVRPLTRSSQKHYTQQRGAASDQVKMYWEFYRQQRSALLPLVRKNIDYKDNNSPVNHLILFLKKAYLKHETQRMVWKGRSGGAKQFRRFREITSNRILPRLSHRIHKLPVFRLRFLYMFDICALWIYFFFKKIARFLKLFFYEQWCNLYFFLSSRGRSSFNFVRGFSWGLFNNFASYFENYMLIHKTQGVGLAAARFSILIPYSFTSLFKIMCLFWNKRKYKHFILRIPSKRWRKKFRFLRRRSRNKKYTPFWKKIKTTRFFIPRKILRLKFRRQHGYKIISDYLLRTQLRRLKPKMRTKRAKILPPRRPQALPLANWFIPENLLKGKYFKSNKVQRLDSYVRLFLENRRRAFIRCFTSLKYMDGISETSETETREKSIKMSPNSLAFDERLFLKRFCKGLHKLSPRSFAKLVIVCVKYFSPQQAAPFNNPWAPQSVVKLFYGDDLWASILHQVLLEASREAGGFDFFGDTQPAPVIESKKIQKQGLTYAPFIKLYEQLSKHKIKARRLSLNRRHAKNRKLKAVLNRRKLLLAIKFKAILPKGQRAPLFCFNMPKRNFRS